MKDMHMSNIFSTYLCVYDRICVYMYVCFRVIKKNEYFFRLVLWKVGSYLEESISKYELLNVTVRSYVLQFYIYFSFSL